MNNNNIVLNNVQTFLNTKLAKPNLNVLSSVPWLFKDNPGFLENVHKPILTPEALKTLLSFDSYTALTFLIGFHAINFQFWSPKSPSGFQPYIHNGQSGFYSCLDSYLSLFVNLGPKLKSLTQVDFFNAFGDIPLAKERFKILQETWSPEKLDNIQQFLETDLQDNIVTLNTPIKISKTLPFAYEDPFYRKAIYFVWDYLYIYNIKHQTNIQQQLPFIADHQTAKIFHMYGLVSYSDDIQLKINNGEFFIKDSPEELAIRACIVFLAQQICQRNKISTMELYNVMWHMRTSKQGPFYLCENQRY